MVHFFLFLHCLSHPSRGGGWGGGDAETAVFPPPRWFVLPRPVSRYIPFFVPLPFAYYVALLDTLGRHGGSCAGVEAAGMEIVIVRYTGSRVVVPLSLWNVNSDLVWVLCRHRSGGAV